MFDSVATAVKPAIGVGTRGGTTQDFTPGDTGVTTLFTNVPCSYQEASPSVQALYAQRDQVVTNTVYFAQDPGDLVGSKLTITRCRTGDTVVLVPVGNKDPVQLGQTWVWEIHAERKRQPV